MNCHLAITRVKFVYLIDACVLRRKLNGRFHNNRRRRVVHLSPLFSLIYIMNVMMFLVMEVRKTPYITYS